MFKISFSYKVLNNTELKNSNKCPNFVKKEIRNLISSK